MLHDYNILEGLGLIAASATVLRASAQPNATVLDRICDGTALIWVGVPLVVARFGVVPAP